MRTLIYTCLALVLMQGCNQDKMTRTKDGAVVLKPNYTNDETAENNAQPFAVLELFTSEGCSSCPPAYIVAQDIMNNASKKGQRVYLLDFHVDYWNELGWEDPYSSPINSHRQKKYARLFPKAGLYTPQMVVNGREEFVGSDPDRSSTAIKTALSEKPELNMAIKVNNPESKDSMQLSYQLSQLPSNTVLNVALIQKEATTKVLKGENAGKTLTHHNVVRVFESVPVTDKAGTVKIAPYTMPADQSFSVVAYVQDNTTMQILAADSEPLK